MNIVVLRISILLVIQTSASADVKFEFCATRKNWNQEKSFEKKKKKTICENDSRLGYQR